MKKRNFISLILSLAADRGEHYRARLHHPDLDEEGAGRATRGQEIRLPRPARERGHLRHHRRRAGRRQGLGRRLPSFPEVTVENLTLMVFSYLANEYVETDWRFISS